MLKQSHCTLNLISIVSPLFMNWIEVMRCMWFNLEWPFFCSCCVLRDQLKTPFIHTFDHFTCVAFDVGSCFHDCVQHWCPSFSTLALSRFVICIFSTPNQKMQIVFISHVICKFLYRFFFCRFLINDESKPISIKFHRTADKVWATFAWNFFHFNCRQTFDFFFFDLMFLVLFFFLSVAFKSPIPTKHR